MKFLKLFLENTKKRLRQKLRERKREKRKSIARLKVTKNNGEPYVLKEKKKKGR